MFVRKTVNKGPLAPALSTTPAFAEAQRPSAIAEALVAAWERGSDSVALLAHYKTSVGWAALGEAGRLGCVTTLHALGCQRNAHTLAKRWRQGWHSAFAEQMPAWSAQQRALAQAEQVPVLQAANETLRRQLRQSRQHNNALQVQNAALEQKLWRAEGQLAQHSAAADVLLKGLVRPGATAGGWAARPARLGRLDSNASSSSDETLYDWAADHEKALSLTPP